LVPETSIASICSVTFIEPSSAPIPDPILPVNIKAVITGPISRIKEIATIDGTNESAPNFPKVGKVCNVRVNPKINEVTPISESDLLPISNNCLENSLMSYGGCKTSFKYLIPNFVSS